MNCSSLYRRYTVTHAGQEDEVRIDQTAGSGWRYLGRFDFDSGDGQFVALHDNTGEALSDHIPIGFDAVRMTPVVQQEPDGSVAEPDATVGADAHPDSDAAVDFDSGFTEDASSSSVRRASGGCDCRSSGQAPPVWALLGLLFVFSMRRRRRGF